MNSRGMPQPGPKRRRTRGQAIVILAILVFAALLGLILLVSPTSPYKRASYTPATASGEVEGSAGLPDATYSGLVISEVMSANKSAVPDENGSYGDWIEIWNSTDHEIDLSGVGLSDKGDTIRFLFPDVSLAPGGRTVVFCDDTNSADIGGTFHAKFKLSSTGETVYLYDPSAYLIDSVSFPIMGTNESWALIDGSFQTTQYYSPGFENTQEGYQEYLAASMVSDGALIINEVMADPRSGLTDEDGDFVDWVELYNTTDTAISLDNYTLSDDEGKPLKWHFPSGAVIAAHGYYLVYCSGKDRADDATAVPHTNFRISA